MSMPHPLTHRDRERTGRHITGGEKGGVRKVFVLIGLLSSLVGLFLYWYRPAFLQAVELKAGDARFMLRGGRNGPQEIVLVAVDERSVNELGRWPWSRRTVAKLIDALEPARVIALDIVFSEPGPKEDDRLLSEAIARSGRVVLGYFFRNDSTEEPPEESIKQLETSSIKLIRKTGGEADRPVDALGVPAFRGGDFNIPSIGKGAAGFGSFNILSGPDGMYRSANLVFAFRGALYPSLALEALSKFFDTDPVLFTAPYGIDSLGLAGIKVPLREDGSFALDFYGPGGTFTTYPAVDVLKGRVDGAKLRDKIVFVGVTEKAVYDIRPTPLDPLLPGVEIHATVAGNILEKSFLIHDTRTIFIDLLILAAAPLLMCVILSHLRSTYQGLIVFFLFLGFVSALNIFLFISQKLVTSTVYPLLPLALAYLLSESYRNVVVEKRHRFMKRAFSTYLSPQLLGELLKDPERLRLGGEKREISVLFADIRGFTGLSERLPPEDIVGVLNDYLSPMTEIVLEEGGTLDKYMGDAIMALFNAPLDISDHPVKACITALRMRDKLDELNKLWMERGLVRLRAGIGISTGEAVVGNMGAHFRFDYTAIGDTVNLASRLEALNKVYGTSIIVSEKTADLVKDEFILRELDLVRVRGRERPLLIYELLGRGKPDTETKDFLEAFKRGLKLYRDGRFEEALRTFSEILQNRPDDGPSRLYANRCRRFIDSPPPKDWDGVFEQDRG